MSEPRASISLLAEVGRLLRLQQNQNIVPARTSTPIPATATPAMAPVVMVVRLEVWLALLVLVVGVTRIVVCMTGVALVSLLADGVCEVDDCDPMNGEREGGAEEVDSEPVDGGSLVDVAMVDGGVVEDKAEGDIFGGYSSRRRIVVVVSICKIIRI